MGWASGSGILSEVWGVVRDHIPPASRVRILNELMEVFANEDCDTLDEVVCEEWPESQAAYDLMYPPEE